MIRIILLLILSANLCGCVVEEVRSGLPRYFFEQSGDIAARYRAKADEARNRPHDPEAHWYLGNYYLNLKMEHSIEKAVSEFAILTKMTPDSPKGYYGLGLCAEARGNLKLAIFQYQTAIDKDPGYADAYRNLSRVYKNQGDRVRAQKYMTKYEGIREAQDFLRTSPHPLTPPVDRPKKE
ncbi:MAG: tetratricopeptide repeat protein [Planctomycetota bacterium]|nr:MAG: tetratricopeptide repeat protein [Planctomycetota bacterium]